MPPKRCKRKPFSSWFKFVRANMESIVACNLFTKNIHTFRGKFQAYSIVFIHYATRRVYVSPPAYNPDDEWMMQQARNVSMWMEDEGIKLKYHIRDGDGKFSKRFDEFFNNIIKDNDQLGKSRGRVITDPVRVTTAPRCPLRMDMLRAGLPGARVVATLSRNV